MWVSVGGVDAVPAMYASTSFTLVGLVDSVPGMSNNVVMLDERVSLAGVLKPGVLAVRRLWRPFVLIQMCAGALVASYFLFEPVRAVCERIADLKMRGGYPLAALAMAVGPGLLPEVFKSITKVDRSWTRQRRANIAFNVLLFAILGVLGDAFYKLQVRAFGDQPRLAAIAGKVAVDQFLYSPFVSLPLIAMLFTLRHHRWRPGAAAGEIGATWYLKRVVTLLVACWAFWIPMSTLMYMLPGTLTFAFCCVASAAWALVMVAVASHGREVAGL